MRAKKNFVFRDFQGWCNLITLIILLWDTKSNSQVSMETENISVGLNFILFFQTIKFPETLAIKPLFI